MLTVTCTSARAQSLIIWLLSDTAFVSTIILIKIRLGRKMNNFSRPGSVLDLEIAVDVRFSVQYLYDTGLV